MATRADTTTLTAIEIKDLPAQDYLGVRFTASVQSIGRDVQAAFARLYSHISVAGSRPSGPPFLIASPPSEGTLQVEVGAPCTPVPEPAAGLHTGRLEGGPSATVLYRGPYDRIGKAYEALFAWIGTHGHHPQGDAREIYLNGPDEATTPGDYLTEVVVPIR
ncbi:MAG TPA: GyrI-like domain-containing protein [Candidatus Dormibacteraeota bacterium]|nr:GyrI-like domain-containing protein [Candidatus Dormibacteraeota bacterium]